MGGAGVDRSRILGRRGPLSPRPGTARSASAPGAHPGRARMVVWLNAAPRMQAGARRSKKKRRLWKKPSQDPLCPCATGGLMVVRVCLLANLLRFAQLAHSDAERLLQGVRLADVAALAHFGSAPRIDCPIARH